MSTALNGTRIIDLSKGPAVGIATMILADFGAEVIVIDPPGDDIFRSLAAAPMWRRGKQNIELDLTTERDRLLELCACADVLVTNFSPDTLSNLQLDLTDLEAQFKHLIICHTSAFGDHGEKANLPGYEHLVAAACGRMMTFQGTVDRPGPVFSALQVGVHATAQSSATGILAALWHRQVSGESSTVTTSLLQGMLPYEQGAMIARQFPARFSELLATEISPEPPLPTLFYHPTQAADGSWLQFGNLLPHLFDNFLMVTDLMDVLADPDFEPTQLLLAGESQEKFRARMLSRIQEKSADQWMSACIENGGVVAGKYQTTQDALSEPDIIQNGHVIDRRNGGVQLGPLAKLNHTPASPGADCQAGAFYQQWLNSPRTVQNAARSTSGAPLAGVRVLELATIIAAPMGASLLADLGAEVIKVEQIGGDPYRGFSFGVGSARVNAGKRSICLNLKSAAGQKVVAQLASNADILIHNYRPGVPERLGFGYEQVQASNPNIVYLQCNGYGPAGPGAHRPCTHPIPGASMGGVLYQMGQRIPETLQHFESLRLWAARIMRANEVNPDPNTALVVATSALLGLVARTNTGTGQQIYIDMFGANAYANHDDFLTYPGKPGRLMPDEQLLGLNATYRLYPCADEQWVFLAIPQSHEQVKFSSVLLKLGYPDISPELLAADDASTADALSALFIAQSADYWEVHLSKAKLGCVRADRYNPAQFWLSDPQAKSMHLTQQVTHPQWGEYQRHASNVTLNRITPTLGPPPLGGQHTDEILAELNYSAQDIATLHAQGVTWYETPEIVDED